MSFILDALRKSEHERQRQTGPAVAELPVARPDARTPWLLGAVAALVLLNLAVLAFFLLRDERGEPAAAAPATAPVAAAVTPPPAAPVPAPAPAVAAPAPVEVPPPVAAAETVPLEQLLPASPDPAPALPVRPPSAPDPTLLPVAPAPRVTTAPAGVPSIHALPPQDTAGLPALSIDLHIYADDPARRAVFINGRRYQEGGALAEGPVVESITRDGAVLSHRGRRFLLPRQ